MTSPSEDKIDIGLHSDPEQLTHPDARALFTYWRSLSELGKLPKWSRVDLLSIPKLVPNLNVQEVLYNPLQFRMLLLGRNIVDQVGDDSTGENITDVKGTSDVVERFNRVILEDLGYYTSNVPVTWASRDHKTYASLVLPVTNEEAVVSHLLCWVGGFS